MLGIFGDGLVEELWMFFKDFPHLVVLTAIEVIVDDFLVGIEDFVSIAHLYFKYSIFKLEFGEPTTPTPIQSKKIGFSYHKF